jgi:DNA (cytosine-5)-methyltransferase 1
VLSTLDLFSGIGGFSLGLEATGSFRTMAFCEIEPFCQAVLCKHWPSIPIHTDITKLDGRPFVGTDVICGGFPCQDISVAGRAAGIEGARSGLWKEYARLIGEIRPRYVIVENVSALLDRGLGRVLGDLAALGYDAEWHCIPASAVGAPHRRDRVWIVAYPVSEGLSGHQLEWEGLRRFARKTSTEFGDEIICCGTEWPQLGGYLRMGDGVPREVDEVKSLGNSIVPQIAEIIGQAIMRREDARLEDGIADIANDR